MRRVRTVALRAGIVLTVAAAVVLGFGAAASAHVTVNPGTATQGGFAKLTFRVPNEKTDAGTVKLEVQFPPDAPITSVSVKPLTGWSADVQRRTLDQPITGSRGEQITEVVSLVTWTAAPGVQIAAGQFQEFDISVGPLPAVDRVIFKALQTYSDGEVVRWIDEPTPGVELEHPAPVLRLLPPGGETAAAAEGGGSGSGAALGLGVAGTVLGLAGLTLGLLAYRRTRAS